MLEAVDLPLRPHFHEVITATAPTRDLGLCTKLQRFRHQVASTGCLPAQPPWTGGTAQVK